LDKDRTFRHYAGVQAERKIFDMDKIVALGDVLK
jgi:hypothetical protein